MSELLEQLKQLNRAVPDAPGFVSLVTRNVAELHLTPSWKADRRLNRKRFAIGAMAASVLVGAVAMLMLSEFSLSPQQAFGQMMQRVEQLDSVRYSVTSGGDGEHAEPAAVDRRTVASGGRRRSELKTSGFPAGVFVHNAKTSSEADLWIYPDERLAEFELVDKEREALADDNPVDGLKTFAMLGVKAGLDETYAGKPARVFVSAEPESINGGQQLRTRRVLVDKTTDLPLRIEVETKVAGRGIFRMVMDQFDWHPAINDGTFSTAVPAGYAVTYDLIKPVELALGVYDACFHQLPDRFDSGTLAALRQKLGDESAADPKAKNMGPAWDAEWGFAVPVFAAKRKIDFRYYGAGKKLDRASGKTQDPIAAVETAPGSGKYDVLMSNSSRAQVDQLQLP